MEVEIFQVDAFASRLFQGNPAAICLLEEALPERIMQKIASENNLAETAFVLTERDGYRLRWFTPEEEIDLCGHATLAAAHVLFRHKKVQETTLRFKTLSGVLSVTRSGERLRMLLPLREPDVCALPAGLAEALGIALPFAVYKAKEYLLVLENEAAVRALQPDFQRLNRIDAPGIIVTAAGEGNDVDFVSRYFATNCSVPEDPVTGSAHCSLAPYWAKRLGLRKLRARQLSERGGELSCEMLNGQVALEGEAVTYLHGKLYLALDQ
ncbi:PhzF family phenazine biosynthesis protein [Azotosporobacter soli]|uniref:PhzF family phenazine biosynthesis protein n=1 Tax=Azotosporobacter soli TaxID=3055040 RepID=UPI0031FEE269